MQLNRLDRYQTVLVLRDHDSVWGAESQVEVAVAVEALHQGLRQVGYLVVPIQIKSPQDIPLALEPFDRDECVVFNWCEGVEPGANDLAQITALLDRLGYIYTGADTRALLTTQDKTFVKHVLFAHGIPTPKWRTVLGDRCKWERYPAIIKVANEHGSEALTSESVVYDQPGLQARVAELVDSGKSYLMVSDFIDGREFTVALWGNGHVQALPLVEIDYAAYPSTWPRLRSFEAKWQTDSPMYQRARLVCPPRLGGESRNRITRVALDAYLAFNLRDYGRIDIRVRDGVPYVIDVNANPDLSAGSSFVIAAEQAGYDYGAMLSRIVGWAVQRAPVRPH